MIPSRGSIEALEQNTFVPLRMQNHTKQLPHHSFNILLITQLERIHNILPKRSQADPKMTLSLCQNLFVFSWSIFPAFLILFFVLPFVLIVVRYAQLCIAFGENRGIPFFMRIHGNTLNCLTQTPLFIQLVLLLFMLPPTLQILYLPLSCPAFNAIHCLALPDTSVRTASKASIRTSSNCSVNLA